MMIFRKNAFLIYPCDKQGYYNRVLGFFPVLNFVTGLIVRLMTLVHNQFKFCSVSCILSLVVTKTPGKSKFMGFKSNHDQFFFQTVNIPVQKKSVHLSAYVSSA